MIELSVTSDKGHSEYKEKWNKNPKHPFSYNSSIISTSL